jgi:hypothetical protein
MFQHVLMKWEDVYLPGTKIDQVEGCRDDVQQNHITSPLLARGQIVHELMQGSASCLSLFLRLWHEESKQSVIIPTVDMVRNTDLPVLGWVSRETKTFRSPETSFARWLQSDSFSVPNEAFGEIWLWKTRLMWSGQYHENKILWQRKRECYSH